MVLWMDETLHHLRNPGKFPCKYQQTTVSHGFKVVRNGFRPSTVRDQNMQGDPRAWRTKLLNHLLSRWSSDVPLHAPRRFEMLKYPAPRRQKSSRTDPCERAGKIPQAKLWKTWFHVQRPSVLA